MPRNPDSGQLDLAEVFRRVRAEMLAQLAVDALIEHGGSAGAAAEQHWLQLFHRYLPNRYSAQSAFVIDSAGHRSRQIDIAIFDNLNSPLLFPNLSGPNSSGLHVSVESVYAVFEVKSSASREKIKDAGEKVASVRALHRTSVSSTVKTRPILAGLLASSSVWMPASFATNVRRALRSVPDLHRLDLGCSLEHGAFEYNRTIKKSKIKVSSAEESLLFFVLRLIERLQEMGAAPEADWMQYAKSLRSLK